LTFAFKNRYICNMKKIVILPVFNEARRVEGVLAELRDFAEHFIVIDDGSTDASYDILRAWSQDQPGVKLVRFPVNRGKAKALQCAFAWIVTLLRAGVIAAEDIIFTTDADGQIKSQDLSQALSYMQEHDLEALISRRDFSLYPAYKIAGNRLLSLNASLAAGRPLHDSECGLRLLRAGLVPRLLPFYTGVRYSAEQEISVILSRLGVKLDNEFTIALKFYHSNTTLKDFFLNLLLGQIAWLRVRFNQSQAVDRILAAEAVYLEDAHGAS
jgi:glycosyltransferase involved in cell wall biosynthesis